LVRPLVEAAPAVMASADWQGFHGGRWSLLPFS